jgi:hypothetical protein
VWAETVPCIAAGKLSLDLTEHKTSGSDLARKGLPAACAWLKAKWNAGKAELEGNVDDAHARLDSFEHRVSALTEAFMKNATPAQAAPQAAAIVGLSDDPTPSARDAIVAELRGVAVLSP